MNSAWKFLLLVPAFVVCACATAPERTVSRPPQSDDPYFQAGAARLATLPQGERARNVIIFVGDGMGVTTVTAARIFAGQRQGLDGESYQLTMDTFPHTALSRTYGVDAQISDSAPTATALTNGVKAGNFVIGLSSGATVRECADWQAHVSQSVFEMAEAAGLATGVVSTARLTHATPASTYAHTPNRMWENDAIVPSADRASCHDIARQFIEWPAGDGFEIALGGGRTNFLPAAEADPEDNGVHGARADGRNLIGEWTARPDHTFVWNTEQLRAAAPDAHILGLFSVSDMAFESERADNEPSLTEMTSAAIRRLQREPNGYVLMVEGGRIDHAHHAGNAGQALSETVAFDDAIRAALEMTSRDDTLIIVTADHSHTLTMSGYAERGTPILGLSTMNGTPVPAADGLPYTTLGYANGPGAVYPPRGREAPAARPDLTDVDTQAMDFHQQALVPTMGGETHGGEDVAIYAWGPGAEAVAGTLEQNVVFHIMARALGFSWR